MAKRIVKAKSEPLLGMCRDCSHSYDYHEMTNYEPRRPFLCKCPFEQWSQFLNKKCVNGHFKKK